MGSAFGLLFPVAWLLIRAFASRRAWWLSWGATELQRHYEVYITVGIVAVAVCALIGYAIGWQNDRWFEESETVRDSNLELSHRAATDPLTGLFNARSIHERLDVEIEDSVRSALSCLIIDIDHFKKINDTYGHPFGDTVLVAVARALKLAVRRIDAVGRLGGEEFVVLLPGIPRSQALAIAERVREAVADEQIFLDSKRVRVTVSVGAATYPAPGLRTKQALLKAADDALYKAKRAGRNRSVVWESDDQNGAEDPSRRAA